MVDLGFKALLKNVNDSKELNKINEFIDTGGLSFTLGPVCAPITKSFNSLNDLDEFINKEYSFWGDFYYDFLNYLQRAKDAIEEMKGSSNFDEFMNCFSNIKETLENIIDDPPSDTLGAFAEDFYARKYNKKRTSVVTDMLRNASRTLNIDVSQNQQVERGVLAHYARQGIQGWRTENRLWRSLFGLMFWQQLYEEDTLVTEFDRRPLSLKQNNFYEKFKDSIEALLSRLNSKDALRRHIHKNATQHYGKVNSLFMWSSHLLTPLEALIEHGDLKAIYALLRMMCRDFPDRLLTTLIMSSVNLAFP